MKKKGPRDALLILTIGHSNRDLESFIAILKAQGVKRVIDIRTMPRSWHNPQFNKDTLAKVLRARGIAYRHMAGLGGLRHSRADSPNMAWRNKSFRGYADYMQTPAFDLNVEKLIEVATKARAALMCAEAVPWRCHRSLVADALVVRGVAVEHIMSGSRRDPHVLRSWAKVRGTRITYPAEELTAARPIRGRKSAKK